MTKTLKDYEAFISSIDDSVAGKDEFGGLAWHIDCSATANMDGGDDWDGAYRTAEMIMDCWPDFYPQIVL